MPVIAVCGHGRHGKGTTCNVLSQMTGLSYPGSTSWAMAPIVFEELEWIHHYASPQECWEDRANHRTEWHNIILRHNNEKPGSIGSRLYEDMISDGAEIIEGIRDEHELNACRVKGLFDFVVWVDASGRGVKPEKKSSNSVCAEHCDEVIDNGGDLEQLHGRVLALCLKRRIPTPGLLIATAED